MQETFNTIVRHLRAQGCRASVWDPDTHADKCYYRLGDLKCAAGVLISDEVYDPLMENRNINKVADIFGIYIPHIDLVMRMQVVHDIWKVSEWEGQFHVVAKEFGLVVPN